MDGERQRVMKRSKTYNVGILESVLRLAPFIANDLREFKIVKGPVGM